MIGTLTIIPPEEGTHWRIVPRETADAAQLCLGLTAEEVVRRVSSVFSLCGAAHAEAASVALGLKAPLPMPSPSMRREILRDHALALLLDLPPILGMAPARDALAALLRLERQEPDVAAARRLLTGTEADIGAFTRSDLDLWLADAQKPEGPVVARALAHIRREIDPGFGRAELPPLGADDIHAALIPDARSSHPNAPARCEATILGDLATRPLMQDLLRSEGASLFVRLLARLLDLLDCLCPSDDTGRGYRLPSIGKGIGLARAARGLLVHQAEILKGRIAAYRILSPTFWNLQPLGLLERMFVSLPAGCNRFMLAQLVVTCVNPCVPVTFVPVTVARG
ncbi:nickel-dependent hydrogenase large subunit [Beijerinckia mobilis]|uniref:nickel-dependent hydrogenase large subunit n=1 Tax=Beijerinckia mobilis TaxID=231434 RepID=UPI000554A7B8|nr:nickel-dependent hydrogenase large subunit [Beijerinckia mobilis]